MRIYRYASSMLFALCLALLLFSCGGDTTHIPLSITPQNPAIPQQTTQQFAAATTSSDGTTQDVTLQVAWSSSNHSVATVDSRGLATAIGPGTTTITASSGNVSGSTTLTVTTATVSSIAVTPHDASIGVGATQPFTAMATLSDGSTQDVTSTATWSSSDHSVATVDKTGVATGVAKGNTIIAAQWGNPSGTANLEVGAATVSSLSITPTNPSIRVGATQAFGATGTLSDGTTQDVTSTATWSSSDTTVATITSGGVATGIAAGTATISAISGSSSASTTLTVMAR